MKQRHTRQDRPVAPDKISNSVVQKNVRDTVSSKQSPGVKQVTQKNVRPVEVQPFKKEPPIHPKHLEINIEKKIESILPPKSVVNVPVKPQIQQPTQFPVKPQIQQPTQFPVKPQIQQSTNPTKEPPDYYLGFGGMGDALLVLAVCWDNPKAHVVFFGNDSSLPFIKDFFQTFKVRATIMPNIMGKPMANTVFNKLKRQPTFRESSHLADGLDYGDWRNEDKYIPRIKTQVPEWRSRFGLLAKNLVVIAPSGSHRDIKRQRYLSRKEYERLVIKYLSKGYEVFGIGSDRDYQEYFFQEKGVWWATNRILRDCHGGSTNQNLGDMLRIINSATEVISMDTWMKTYSLIAGIQTTMIATRWDGKYKNYGEDITDWVFLNPKIWPNLKIVQIEDFLL